VLGACLLSERAVAVCAEIVRPADFYRKSHGVIFQAMLDLHAGGGACDAITVVDGHFAFEATRRRGARLPLQPYCSSGAGFAG